MKFVWLVCSIALVTLVGCGGGKEPVTADVPYLTSENFDAEVYESEVPVLVDFTATWCAPCKIVDPIVEDLMSEMGGRAKITKVDIDESPDIYQRLRVNGVPTVVFFNDGEEQDRIASPQTRETYAHYLNAMIAGESGRQAGMTLLDDDAFRRHFIVSRDIDAVEEVLAERPDLFIAQFENGQTPLSLILNTPSVRQNALVELVLAGDPELSANELVGLGRCEELKAAIAVDPEAASRPDPDGATPLFVALTREHRLENGGCLRTLLDAGADPSRAQNEQYSISWAVILKKDVALLDEFLDRGMDPNATNAEGMNALHYAALYGQSNSVRLLLQRGVDAGMKTARGQTAADIVRERREASVKNLEGDPAPDLLEYYTERVQEYDELLALLERARS